MSTIIQFQQHPLTRQRRAAEAAESHALRLGLPQRGAKAIGDRARRLVRAGRSAGMAIALAIREARGTQHREPQA